MLREKFKEFHNAVNLSLSSKRSTSNSRRLVRDKMFYTGQG